MDQLRRRVPAVLQLTIRIPTTYCRVCPGWAQIELKPVKYFLELRSNQIGAVAESLIHDGLCCC